MDRHICCCQLVLVGFTGKLPLNEQVFLLPELFSVVPIAYLSVSLIIAIAIRGEGGKLAGTTSTVRICRSNHRAMLQLSGSQ